MIVGGSPCQDFSVAGKQKGSKWKCKCCGHEYNPLTVHWSERGKCPECGSEELDKTRSSLLVEWLRVIRANKPKFGIYENVKNIVGKQFKDTTFKLFEEELHEYGYNTYWKVLNAKNYGVPQNRERVYLILIQKELDNGRFMFPESIQSDIRIKDLLEDEVDEKYYISTDKLKGFLLDNDFTKKSDKNIDDVDIIGYVDGTNFNQNKTIYNPNGIAATVIGQGHCGNEPKIAIKQATKKGYIECEVGGVADLSYPDSKTRRGRVQDSGNTSPTITATETGVCRIEDEFRVRKLIPLECFRLMSFTDEDFNAAKNVGLSDTQLYKQAGNSIVVEVLHRILVELYLSMPYLFENLTLSSYFSGIGAFEKALDLLFEDIETGNFTTPPAK